MKSGPYLAMAEGAIRLQTPGVAGSLAEGDLRSERNVLLPSGSFFPGNGLLVDPAIGATSRSVMASLPKSTGIRSLRQSETGFAAADIVAS